MKIKNLVIVLFFVLSRLSSVAQHEPEDSLYCLDITGEFENVFHFDKKRCLVEVIHEQGTDSIYLSKWNKKFRYSFVRNREYCIRVSKPGFATMILCIDTRIDPSNKEFYSFAFKTNLITEKRAKTFSRELLQEPMVVVKYDERKDHFSHDEQYTSALKRDLVLRNRIW